MRCLREPWKTTPSLSLKSSEYSLTNQWYGGQLVLIPDMVCLAWAHEPTHISVPLLTRWTHCCLHSGGNRSVPVARGMNCVVKKKASMHGFVNATWYGTLSLSPHSSPYLSDATLYSKPVRCTSWTHAWRRMRACVCSPRSLVRATVLSATQERRPRRDSVKVR